MRSLTSLGSIFLVNLTAEAEKYMRDTETPNLTDFAHRLAAKETVEEVENQLDHMFGNVPDQLEDIHVHIYNIERSVEVAENTEHFMFCKCGKEEPLGIRR